VGRGHRAQLSLDGLPHGHGVDADAFAGQARHEHISTVGLLQQSAKAVGDLESPLIIDFRRSIAPEDGV
jgi:hypothetical protein